MAVFPSAIATDTDLRIAKNNVRTRLVGGINSIVTSITVLSSTGIVAGGVISVDEEIMAVVSVAGGGVLTVIRNYDNSTAAAHVSNSLVECRVTAKFHEGLKEEIIAIETALGVNLASISEGIKASTAYDFTAQTPGGSLIVGSNTITLARVPVGVNGSDARHWYYISGGTGTAEIVLGTGGTAVSGAATGTLIFTCAFTHTGAWTIRSATSGIYEAFIALGTGALYIPPGDWPIYAPMDFAKADGWQLYGERGISRLVAQSTLLSSVDLIAASGTVAASTVATDNYPFATRQNANNPSLTLASVAGLAAGDLLLVLSGSEVTYGNNFAQTVIVGSIAINTVTLDGTLKIPYVAALAGDAVQQYSPLREFSIRGLSIDMQGFGRHAVYVGYAEGCEVSQVSVENNTAGAAVIFFVGYRNRAFFISTTNSGTTGYNDISFYYQTQGQGGLWNSDRASGFGPGLFWSVDCTIVGINVAKSVNRGFKLSASAWCNVIGARCDGSELNTGFSVANGSYRCNVNNVSCTNNLAGGFWHSDQDNCFNTYAGILSVNNTAGGFWDLNFSASDHDNSVTGLISGSGTVLAVVDLGTNNYIERALRPMCKAYRSASAQSIPDSVSTSLVFDAEDYDTLNMHSTSSNPERIAIPTGCAGVYEFTLQVTFAANATGFRQVDVIDSLGSTRATQQALAVPSGLPTVMSISGTINVAFTGPTYIVVSVFQSSGGALNVTQGAGVTYCSVKRL